MKTRDLFHGDVVGKRVMIIDEEVDLCLLLKVIFMNKGCTVYISHTLEDTFNRIDQIEPDYVLIDPPLLTSRGRVVKGLLEAAPSIQLIAAGGTIVYESPACQL